MMTPCSRTLGRVEILLLTGFLFFLPLAEAPKNLFLYIFIIFWVLGSWRARNWGGGDRLLEWPLLVICLLSLLPVMLRESGWIPAFNNCVDFFSITVLLIVIARSRFSESQFHLLAAATGLGVMAALLDGQLRGGKFPYLHSVGHINQVAQYLGLVACAATGYFAYAKNFKATVWSLVTLVGFAYLTFATASRNAYFGVLMVIVTLLLITLACRDLRSFARLALIPICIVSSLTLLNPTALERQASQFSSTGALVDDARWKLWKSAFTVSPSLPFYGAGVGFFGEGNSPWRVQEIVESKGEVYKSTNYFFTNHGHNLFATWLVERGPLALLMLICWLCYLTFVLIRELKRAGDSTARPWLGAGVATLFASILFGIGNTSWHHEHGMLAAVLIALAVSNRSSTS